MSRKNNRPQYHEPVNTEATANETEQVVIVEVFDPIEDTIEVGEVILVDGPLDAVPLGERSYNAGDYGAPSYSFETTPEPEKPGAAFDAAKDAAADKAQEIGQGVAQKAQDVGQKAQDVGQKAQDVVQDVTKTAQDAAKGAAAKTQDLAQGVADKVQDVAQSVAGKAQDVTQKVAEKTSTVKAAAGDALDSAKSAVPAAKGVLSNAAGKIGTASASGAQSVGSALWTLIQRNPLQAIFVISSLIWLFRSNKAAASQPPVSLTDAAGDAAEKVGTVAGQVQVAATNLSSQVSEQATRGAGWFTQTLQTNPLAIGAMAIVFGAGLGFSVPETPYENNLLGKTRDELADKVQAAAQDLTQKVTTVAQTAAHDAVESAKAEAKNQGLTAEAAAPEQPQAQDQPLAIDPPKTQDQSQS